MKIYTVIGQHENGEVFAEQQKAKTPSEAMDLVAARKASYSADAEILGAIQTTARFTPAHEDQGGYSAHVDDLARIHECGNCTKKWVRNELDEIKDYDQRVDEDTDHEPTGECPECGALCYEVEPVKKEQGR